MARGFKEKELEDAELNQLVDKFLEQTPDYLPVFANDGTLLLMPYSGSSELCRDFNLGQELPDSNDRPEFDEVKNAILM